MTQEQKERERTRHAALYAANREKRRALSAAYYAANREKVLARQADYRKANRAMVRARKASYYVSNRENVLARHRAYCAAKPLTAEQKQHKKNEDRKRRLIRKQVRFLAGMALLANIHQASQLGGGTHGGLSDGRDAAGRSPMDAGQHSEASQAHAGLSPQP